MDIKRMVRNNDNMLLALSTIYNFLMGNHLNAKVNTARSFLKKCRIIDHGKNNKIEIEEGCRLNGCCINVYGDNNSITISHDCAIQKLDVWCADGASVFIGHNTHITGATHLAATEAQGIRIGAKCLFSQNITIRNGDSHSIIDENGERVNLGKSVTIGDHVWIGQQVIILKGSNIGSDCVVGTGSILTGKEYASNSVIVGNPAKVQRQGINWDHELL